MTWAESCAPAWEQPWILQAFWHACSGPFVMPRQPSPQTSPVRGEGSGCDSVMPAGPFCHARWSPLSCPLGPSVHLAGSLCPSCWVPLSIPLGPPLSILPGPSVHPAGSPVHPAGPPLSFPPVVSGNPVSFFSVPLFGWPCMGKAVDSRLKMSGMTEGGLETWGVTEGDWKRGE